ncbi:hypothetical protein INR49_019348 [Caranx melampygus]|nr:hypothetical protein INR49_019348 [Caranx melampygus]
MSEAPPTATSQAANNLSFRICPETPGSRRKACIGGYWASSPVCTCPLCKHQFDERPQLSVNKVFALIAEKYKLARYTAAGLPLPVYCRSCQSCICAICVLEEHRTHKTVSVQTERVSKQRQVARTEQEILNRIGQKEAHLSELKRKLDGVKSYADRERGEVERLLDEVSASLDRIRTEVVGRIQNQLDAVMSKGERLSFEEAAAPLPDDQNNPGEDTEFSLHFELGDVKSSLAEVKDKMDDIRMGEGQSRGSRSSFSSGDLMAAESMLSLRGSSANLRKSQWSLRDLKKIKGSSEDVTLNPVTAYPFLILSEDRKQVKRGEKLQFYRNSSHRFDVWSCVSAKEGFNSGRHYWEVCVGENKDWKVGVVSESAQRKGLFDMSPANGYYVIWWSGSQLRALTAPPLTKLKSSQRLRQVGVFLDVEEGQVSFYNAKSGSEIYSFTASSEFTERMFPLLGTGDKEVPLVLVTTQHHLA